MYALVVKTSSLGDILHTFPAISDAHQALPAFHCDWVVEEALAEIPTWHPAVDQVIPVANRRWRRQPGKFINGGAKEFVSALRAQQYDRVVDAQGLMRSALISRLARGGRWGLDRASAREGLAALAYQHRVAADPTAHAVDRMRTLLAACLDYPVPNTPPDYGINRTQFPAMTETGTPYLMFLTGTTWSSKLWPLEYWQELVDLVLKAGFVVRLCWGDETERQRAQDLANHRDGVEVLPRLNLTELAAILADAVGAVAVDTGLGHLAAALGVPCLSIYGATDPARTGTRGENQTHATAVFTCSPCLSRRCSYKKPSAVTPACYATVPPQQVWSTLQHYL